MVVALYRHILNQPLELLRTLRSKNLVGATQFHLSLHVVKRPVPFPAESGEIVRLHISCFVKNSRAGSGEETKRTSCFSFGRPMAAGICHQNVVLGLLGHITQQTSAGFSHKLWRLRRILIPRAVVGEVCVKAIAVGLHSIQADLTINCNTLTCCMWKARFLTQLHAFSTLSRCQSPEPPCSYCLSGAAKENSNLA